MGIYYNSTVEIFGAQNYRRGFDAARGLLGMINLDTNDNKWSTFCSTYPRSYEPETWDKLKAAFGAGEWSGWVPEKDEEEPENRQELTTENEVNDDNTNSPRRSANSQNTLHSQDDNNSQANA